MKQKLQRKMNEKYKGVFPFEFDDSAQGGVVAIPDVIHLIPIGEWQHDLYGPIMITAGDIREFIQNFNAEVRKGVFITAGHEGFAELPAVGWITKLDQRDTGLWGTVEWNELGKETLSDKQYKFFSPEFYRDYEDPQTHQIYRNVLTGGALTKQPYFKELEAVVFSEPKLRKQFNEYNNTMNLKELVAKDITTLTDEEKAFIVEHKAELTEEEKVLVTSIIDAPVETPAAETEEAKVAREAKEAADANVAAGLNPDGSVKVEGSDKKLVQISASELAALQAAADQGQQAFKELNKQKIEASVKALTFSNSNTEGKFLPKSSDKLRAFMEPMNDAQRVAFAALINELPKTQIFTEVGSGGAAEGTAGAELNAKIEAVQKENPKMAYSDALKKVLVDNPGLEARYDAELPSARK